MTLAETVYCRSVVGTFVLGCLGILTPSPLTDFCAIALCTLFPVGLLLEAAHARWPIPRPVVLCLSMTALFVCLILKYNWR